MELSKEFGKIYYIYGVIEKYDDGFTDRYVRRLLERYRKKL